MLTIKSQSEENIVLQDNTNQNYIKIFKGVTDRYLNHKRETFIVKYLLPKLGLKNYVQEATDFGLARDIPNFPANITHDKYSDPFLTTKNVPGEDLSNWIKRQPNAISPDIIKKFAFQLIFVLAKCQNVYGLQHNDIHEGNIKVQEVGADETLTFQMDIDGEKEFFKIQLKKGDIKLTLIDWGGSMIHYDDVRDKNDNKPWMTSNGIALQRYNPPEEFLSRSQYSDPTKLMTLRKFPENDMWTVGIVLMSMSAHKRWSDYTFEPYVAPHMYKFYEKNLGESQSIIFESFTGLDDSETFPDLFKKQKDIAPINYLVRMKCIQQVLEDVPDKIPLITEEDSIKNQFDNLTCTNTFFNGLKEALELAGTYRMIQKLMKFNHKERLEFGVKNTKYGIIAPLCHYYFEEFMVDNLNNITPQYTIQFTEPLKYNKIRQNMMLDINKIFDNEFEKEYNNKYQSIQIVMQNVEYNTFYNNINTFTKEQLEIFPLYYFSEYLKNIKKTSISSLTKQLKLEEKGTIDDLSKRVIDHIEKVHGIEPLKVSPDDDAKKKEEEAKKKEDETKLFQLSQLKQKIEEIKELSIKNTEKKYNELKLEYEKIKDAKLEQKQADYNKMKDRISGLLENLNDDLTKRKETHEKNLEEYKIFKDVIPNIEDIGSLENILEDKPLKNPHPLEEDEVTLYNEIQQLIDTKRKQFEEESKKKVIPKTSPEPLKKFPSKTPEPPKEDITECLTFINIFLVGKLKRDYKVDNNKDIIKNTNNCLTKIHEIATKKNNPDLIEGLKLLNVINDDKTKVTSGFDKQKFVYDKINKEINGIVTALYERYNLIFNLGYLAFGLYASINNKSKAEIEQWIKESEKIDNTETDANIFQTNVRDFIVKTTENIIGYSEGGLPNKPEEETPSKTLNIPKKEEELPKLIPVTNDTQRTIIVLLDIKKEINNTYFNIIKDNNIKIEPDIDNLDKYIDGIVDIIENLDKTIQTKIKQKAPLIYIEKEEKVERGVVLKTLNKPVKSTRSEKSNVGNVNNSTNVIAWDGTIIFQRKFYEILLKYLDTIFIIINIIKNKEINLIINKDWIDYVLENLTGPSKAPFAIPQQSLNFKNYLKKFDDVVNINYEIDYLEFYNTKGKVFNI